MVSHMAEKVLECVMHKTLLITVSQTTVPKIKLKDAFIYS